MRNGGDSHLSIGEVLAELREEFSDVSISKIRFLESQGLIDPERTPSGYRKFHDEDLARLRWILREQKEHFLPLKVIKERLDQLGPGEELPFEMGPTTAPRAEVPVAEETPAVADAVAEPAPPAPAPRAPAPRATTARPPARPRSPAFTPTLPVDDADDERFGVADQGTYSPGDLAVAAGLQPADIEQLESFGLVAPALEVGGEPRYDADALEVARAASGFFARGVEARHLRMYLTFAEREAVLFGQVLLPYVRQRNPEARARLQDELVELATLGRRLRGALLRGAVRDSLTE